MDAVSIFKKGLLLVSIPLLSQLLILGVLAMIRADQMEAQRWALHTKDVISKTEIAYRQAIDAHLKARGFMLTRDDAFIISFRESEKALKVAYVALDNLVVDSELQHNRVQRMLRQSESLMSWLDESIRIYRDGTPEQIAERSQLHEGQKRIDQLGVLTEEFLGEEERLDDERRDYLKNTTHKQNLVLLAGVVLALVSTAVVLYGFSRSVGRRLVVLTENIRRFAAGQELTSLAPGRDEIAEVDHAFHDMAAALMQKNNENEMFVYSVSHDLRAPLVNLQGFSQELATSCKDMRTLLTGDEPREKVRDGCVRLLDREMAESVHYIQTAVSRLESIIEALLRLSRAGRVVYQKQKVDLQAAVGKVVDSLQASISQRGAEVQVGDLPPVWADPRAVDQVFGNLIVNAINYLDPHRAGKIEISRVTDSADGASKDRVVYSVRDNGMGIPPHAVEKVFLAFQRQHPQAAKGEGVGLALVRRVVERHGGRIWLTSIVGVGTTVFVAFPSPPPNSQGTSVTPSLSGG